MSEEGSEGGEALDMIGKLGRLPHDPVQLARLPRLSAYQPPVAPAVVDWTRDLAPGTWSALGNLEVGDCTTAAVGHAVAVWESLRPPARFMTDDEAIAAYSQVSGYVPGNDATDNGARCLDVLNRWKDQGVTCGGETQHLTGFCTLDPNHYAYVRSALWCFGCLYLGITLREQNLAETNSGETWSDTTSPIAGGHCVLVVAADDTGLTCITWGQPQRMTRPFFEAATDEAYGLLSPAWLAAGKAPQSFPVATLMKDMAALRS